MSTYVGWLFVRPDGSIGSDAMPCGEFKREVMPACYLTKHEMRATSSHAALIQMVRLAETVTPGLNRHGCAGVPTNV